MITGLRLDNFRGFITTQDLHFGEINLFYGPNSGGKSTILRTLSLLKQSFNHNQVDPLCVLLPYSRDGVDMGSPTSLHHNLDTSVPFSLSLSSRGREPFRISCPERRPSHVAPKPPPSQVTSAGDATNVTGSYAYFLDVFKNRQMHLDKDEETILFEDPFTDWTLCLTIADDGPNSSSVLQAVRFGNPHCMVSATKVESSSGRGRNAFMDVLRNTVQTVSGGEDFEVFDAFGDGATRRRWKRRPVAAFKRSMRFPLDDEWESSGCYAVENIVLGKDYETALATYLKDRREDIAAFAAAVARDLDKLPPRDQVADEHKPTIEGFRERLHDYFVEVARFFETERDAAERIAWWKNDLRRSRLLMFGYLNAEYDSGDIPPLAYWMTSEWWTSWQTTRSNAVVRQAGGDASFSKFFSLPWDGQCDDINDVVGLYSSTVEMVAKSLAAIRDIGPDRSSAERVYRIEPRQHAVRDHVGRRAAEIPRVLYESPRLLEELNAWLKRVDVPYRLIVDPLEIRGGGRGDVRQTGLFELNAELAHSRNARINLSDVGHGLFKQLALPIQVFLGQKLIITIEEPETNVHPRLQAEIADLFIDAVTKRGHQIFAEAHSEILSLRLRRRIAEGQISHKDVRLFYVYAPDNGPCVVLPLALDAQGNLLNEPPGGFFDEWLNEV